jgi:tetratricopeptide (TPR) repeat protein
VGICAGLPIALCVAAARLAARPRLSVGKVVSELADETNRLRRLSISDGLSVQAALDVSYRFLDPRTATLYRRLSVHPGREFGTGPIAAVTPEPQSEAQADPVDSLLEASLLQEVAEDRFRFHDLVRLHAIQKAETDDHERDRKTAALAILEWYLAAAQQADRVLTPYRRRLVYQFTTTPRSLPALVSRDVALGWLERERVNLIAAGRAALDHEYAELAWHLSDVLWPLFLLQRHYRDRIDVDRCGVAAARRWGNVWAEADMLKRLSRVCAMTRDFEAAERYAHESISRYEEVGDSRGSLDAQESLALVYRDSGREELAATALAGLLDANRRLGAERSAGLMLINLGVLLTTLGRAAEAVPMLREARELFAKLSDVDPYNEVRATIGLSGAYLNTGELVQAEDMATAAAGRMDELGSEHGKAEALSLLGQIAQRRGDIATACAHFLNALHIFDALGSSRATSLRDQVTRLRCA